jgi:NOL1/NOP2/sun family putative RNA methylase
MQLPQALLQSLQNIPGYNQAAFTATHAAAKPPISIRLNQQKITTQQLSLPIAQPIPWCNQGYYLNQRPQFTLDPLMHAGAYYVQEASSMFITQALQQHTNLNTPLKVLDLCAAPGGKTTLLQNLIQPNSILVSNEVIKTRANILCENVTKWGTTNIVVTNNDPKDFAALPQYFDAIVVDAPCSGSGLFRKDEQAVNEWSEANVALCSQRQQRILADVLPALNVGGILVYSTCSYSNAENEDIVDWLLTNYPLESLPLTLDAAWGVVTTTSNKKEGYGYRFFPHLVNGEGFFMAVFKVTAPMSGPINYRTAKNNLKPCSKQDVEVLNNYITPTQPLQFFNLDKNVIALPHTIASELHQLQLLYIKQAGTLVGSIIRQQLLPEHSFALSTIINTTAFAQVQLTLPEALQFLRKADFSLPQQQNGWVLMQYNGLPIGWAKILPNRINNYYPKEWRIMHL